MTERLRDGKSETVDVTPARCSVCGSQTALRVLISVVEVKYFNEPLMIWGWSCARCATGADVAFGVNADVLAKAREKKERAFKIHLV